MRPRPTSRAPESEATNPDSPPAPRGPRRPPLARVDWRGPALAGAGLVVFLLHGFQGELAKDGAVYAYVGQQFADGVPPYFGGLVRTGPLAHAIPGLGALGARAVGADDLLGMRVLLMLISCVGVWLAYLLGRDMFGSRLAGLMTGTTLLTFAGFVEMSTSGPRDKIIIVTFCLAAAWAMSRRWWVAAGVAVALATLTWQQAFFSFGAAAVLAALLVPTWRGRLKAVSAYAAGGLGVLTTVVLAYVAIGGFAEFYEGFAGVHLGGYTKQNGITFKTGVKLNDLRANYGWAVWLLPVGILGLLALGAARLRRLDRDDAGAVATVALALGALIAVSWTLIAYQRWTDSLVLTPYAAIGVGGLTHLLAASRERVTRAGVGLVAVLLVVSGVMSWLDRDDGLVEQRAFNVDMLAAAGPGADIQVAGIVEPLVFTGRRNAVRYFNFAVGLAKYLDDTLPGGLRTLERRLESTRPTVVVRSERRRPEWLTPVLERHYVLVGGRHGVGFWYVDERLDDDRVADMQDVLRRAGMPVAPLP